LTRKISHTFPFMKKTHLIIALLALPLLPCGAAVTIELSIGQFFNATGTQLVPAESRWAVILDESKLGNFPGGLTQNTSLTAANAESAFTAFAGSSITPGTVIGSNRIFSVFDVDGENTSGVDGISTRFVTLPDDDWALLSQVPFAIYWFPGLTSENSVVPTQPFEIGGIQVSTANSGGNIGMTIPTFVTDATLDFNASFYDDSDDIGGDLPLSRFIAITAVPEPSTALLAMLGALGLLVRRRR